MVFICVNLRNLWMNSLYPQITQIEEKLESPRPD